MEIKINKSHIIIYNYLCKLSVSAHLNKKGLDVVYIDYHGIEKATKLSYPTVAKCMIELIRHGCIKKLQDNRGRSQGGSKYLVDTKYEVVKTRVKKEKVYKTKYTVTVLELKKL